MKRIKNIISIGTIFCIIISQYCIYINVLGVDTEPPLTPTITTADQTVYNKSFTIEWNVVDDTDFYEVFIDGLSNGTTTGLEYTIIFYENDTYEIYVKAWNIYGSSPNSNMVTLEVILNLPKTPIWTTKSQKIQIYSYLLLEWNLDFDIDYYKLYLNGSYLDSTTSSNYEISSLDELEYNFHLIAYNNSGESNLSPNITILTGEVPSQPIIINKNQTISENQLLLKWSGSSNTVNYSIFIDGIEEINTHRTFCYIEFDETNEYLINIIAHNDYGNSTNSSLLSIIVDDLIPVMSWNLNSIHIDDSGFNGNGTWNDLIELPWCSGDGSILNPYTLENITLTTGTNDSAIFIENSNLNYFIVKNCIILETGNSSLSAGIKIKDSCDGEIYNNYITGTNTGIYVENSDVLCLFDNIIYNISKFNGFGAIYLLDSDYNEIMNNLLNENILGIYLDNSDLNDVTNNQIEDGLISMLCENSILNYISENCIENMTKGIELNEADNNSIVENIVRDIDYNGLEINYFSQYNIIANNTMQIIGQYGIKLEQSPYNEITRNHIDNEIIFSSIYLDESPNTQIIGNDLLHKIYVNNSPFNRIVGNIFNNTIGSPLRITNSTTTSLTTELSWKEACQKIIWFSGSGTLENPYLISNIIFDTKYGHGNEIALHLINSSKRIEIRNCVFFHNESFVYLEGGIYLEDISNVFIEGCKFYEYFTFGISIENSFNISIENNDFLMNKNLDGIGLLNSEYITIKGNYFYENYVGIILQQNCNNNSIINNIFKKNNKGISISTDNSNDNFFIENKFIDNIVQAEDFGLENFWNNSKVGNYWDDYLGVDSNNDEIGDDPYDIIGDYNPTDYMPIWDRNAPTIKINSPENNCYLNVVELEFNVEIHDSYLDEMWYSFDNGNTNLTFYNNGTINQNIWESLPNEAIIILIFFANDSWGFESNKSISFVKDQIAPRLEILSPIFNDEFGDNIPYFELLVQEPFLKELSYSLLNLNSSSVEWTQKVIFTENTTLDSEIWKNIGDGTIILRFFSEDMSGNVRYSEVLIKKQNQDESGISFGIITIILVVSICSVVSISYFGLKILKQKKAIIRNEDVEESQN